MSFSLFQSPIDLAHRYWERLYRAGTWAIDATCGNGNDTLKLAQIFARDRKSGGVIGIDIQNIALQRTQALLESHLPLETLSHVHLYRQSHAVFPHQADEHPISLIVYNLGYLPRGDKGRTTLTESTLLSVTQALKLIVPGGALSITCYPGHPEGAKEAQALLEVASQLPQKTWNVCHHTFPNRTLSPSLLLIQKII